jgi:hypothetical protein
VSGGYTPPKGEPDPGEIFEALQEALERQIKERQKKARRQEEARLQEEAGRQEEARRQEPVRRREEARQQEVHFKSGNPELDRYIEDRRQAEERRELKAETLDIRHRERLEHGMLEASRPYYENNPNAAGEGNFDSVVELVRAGQDALEHVARMKAEARNSRKTLLKMMQDWSSRSGY